jgi:hypothetical protein
LNISLELFMPNNPTSGMLVDGYLVCKLLLLSTVLNYTSRVMGV